MIVEVNEKNIYSAAEIHSLSWRESHAAFCSEDFVNQHTVERQKNYLANEISDGKRLFLLIHNKPLGIVSVKDSLIENLYILPNEQRKGYGSELLEFAIANCISMPKLWILDNNKAAYALYSKRGFVLTGKSNRLSDKLCEIEMVLSDKSN